MKTLATLALLLVAAPASAAVIWNESVHGDLSSNPAAPTPLVFAPGGNTIIGATSANDRDYLSFTVPAGASLTGLILHRWTPDNLGFMAFNTGPISYIPGAATAENFLSGIHPWGAWVGENLMMRFVTDAVTPNTLESPMLGPGTYSFLVQQTSAVNQQYTLEFVLEVPVPVNGATWGTIKSLYR